jgi:hypothetical protein
MLLTLTLITVFLVVVALAGYLSAVAWALRDASRSVSAIADGLEAVQNHTLPVGDKLATINDALFILAGALQVVDGHLGAAARVFRL